MHYSISMSCFDVIIPISTRGEVMLIVECECCSSRFEYRGGCFMCPVCGLRTCEPIVLDTNNTKVSSCDDTDAVVTINIK
jgi:uncharacterized Zn finger protein (UPF0148 family)